MNTDLMSFIHTNFGEVRGVYLNGEPHLVAVDVCRVLAIKNSHDAISRLPDKNKLGVGITDPHGREQNTTVINESGFYRLIFTSRKPEALAFQDWVFEEVLPAIRKQGFYSCISDEQLIEFLTNRQKENPKFLYNASLKQQERRELLKLTQNERFADLWKKRETLNTSDYMDEICKICDGNLSLYNKAVRRYENYLQQKRKNDILIGKIRY